MPCTTPSHSTAPHNSPWRTPKNPLQPTETYTLQIFSCETTCGYCSGTFRGGASSLRRHLRETKCLQRVWGAQATRILVENASKLVVKEGESSWMEEQERERISELEKKVLELQEQMAELKGQGGVLGRVNELGAQVEIANYRIDTIDQDNSNMRDRMAGLRLGLDEAVGGLQQRLDEVGGLQQRLDESVGGLERRLDESVGELQQKWEESAEGLQRLDDTVGGLQDSVGVLQDTVGELQDSFGGLQQRLDDSVGGLERLERHLEARIDAHQQEVSNLRHHLESRMDAHHTTVLDHLKSLTTTLESRSTTPIPERQPTSQQARIPLSQVPLNNHRPTHSRSNARLQAAQDEGNAQEKQPKKRGTIARASCTRTLR